MSAPIVVQRKVAASPDEVYAYLTESDKWALWQGAAASIDPTPGGLVAMAMPNGMNAQGEFVELVPNRRVVFTWGWVDHPGLPPGSTVVEIDLVAEGEYTTITLTHREVPDEEIPMHVAGWDHYVRRLAHVSEGRDPGPDPGPA